MRDQSPDEPGPTAGRETPIIIISLTFLEPRGQEGAGREHRARRKERACKGTVGASEGLHEPDEDEGGLAEQLDESV